ncbi:hypothetical protein INR49_010603 [Caranx melampygus]|nr:hypothetical protein INR49_010603 [Caranx melampygus]
MDETSDRDGDLGEGSGSQNIEWSGTAGTPDAKTGVVSAGTPDAKTGVVSPGTPSTETGVVSTRTPSAKIGMGVGIGEETGSDCDPVGEGTGSDCSPPRVGTGGGCDPAREGYGGDCGQAGVGCGGCDLATEGRGCYCPTRDGCGGCSPVGEGRDCSLARGRSQLGLGQTDALHHSVEESPERQEEGDRDCREPPDKKDLETAQDSLISSTPASSSVVPRVSCVSACCHCPVEV